MISKIRVLQIGDIHLPTAALARRNIDQKDETFSVELRNIISSTPIKVVFKQIYRILDDDPVDAILVMGDLTDRGEIENYARSAAFLARSLQIGTSGNHHNIPVGIIPGNHDIDRKLAKQPGLSTKFSPLNTILIANGLPAIPVEKSIEIKLKKGTCSASIHLMNSCWGCGASEYIPMEFRDVIEKAIESAIATGGKGTLQAYYDRQFDTPAFSNSSIENLIACTRTVDLNSIFVVAAHHNLLPQRMTRLAPYTELINSGTLRASLLEAPRPVIYLHGHIHEDPIEIIKSTTTGNLINISAPAAQDGFNIIEFLSTRSGLPLSCKIQQWRFNQSGILFVRSSFTVPLIGTRRRSHDDSLSKIYAFLLSHGEAFWNQLVRHEPSFFATDIEQNLREAIELLLADDSVSVENYDFDPPNWIVRAKI